jgi:hypothetical protein
MNIIRIVKDMMNLRVLFRNMTNPTIVKEIKNNQEKIIDIDQDGGTEPESPSIFKNRATVRLAVEDVQ